MFSNLPDSRGIPMNSRRTTLDYRNDFKRDNSDDWSRNSSQRPGRSSAPLLGNNKAPEIDYFGRPALCTAGTFDVGASGNFDSTSSSRSAANYPLAPKTNANIQNFGSVPSNATGFGFDPRTSSGRSFRGTRSATNSRTPATYPSNSNGAPGYPFSQQGQSVFEYEKIASDEKFAEQQNYMKFASETLQNKRNARKPKATKYTGFRGRGNYKNTPVQLSAQERKNQQDEHRAAVQRSKQPIFGRPSSIMLPSVDVPMSSPPTCSKIASFVVYQPEEQECSEIDRFSKKIVDDVDHFRRLLADRNTSIDNDFMAFEVSLDCYPPTLSLRGDYVMKRPIVIDGCGVGHIHSKEKFNGYWKSTDGYVAFDGSRILPTEPLMNLIIDFTCMGYKPEIVLPAYYSDDNSVGGRQKVTNLAYYEALRKCGLIKILEFPKIGASICITWFDIVQEYVKEIGACWIGDSKSEHGHISMITGEKYPKHSNNTSAPNEVNTERLAELEHNNYRRILLPHFLPTKDLSFMFGFHSFVGTNRNDHKSRKDTYWSCPHDSLVNFIDPHDIAIDHGCRLEQQLRFRDQLRLLLILSEVIELEPFQLVAVQSLARIGSVSHITLHELEIYLDRHLPKKNANAEHISSINWQKMEQANSSNAQRLQDDLQCLVLSDAPNSGMSTVGTSSNLITFE